MKDESVLNVLMYIFHNHIKKDQNIYLDDKKLIEELKSAGFHSLSIGRAFRWLARLSELAEQPPALHKHAIRVFNEQECWMLDTECRNFILSLERQGILTPYTRETVIHQTLELIHEGIDISLIKWVTLMVLFNTPGCEDALAHMEFLMEHDALDTVH